MYLSQINYKFVTNLLYEYYKTESNHSERKHFYPETLWIWEHPTINQTVIDKVMQRRKVLG